MSLPLRWSLFSPTFPWNMPSYSHFIGWWSTHSQLLLLHSPLNRHGPNPPRFRSHPTGWPISPNFRFAITLCPSDHLLHGGRTFSTVTKVTNVYTCVNMVNSGLSQRFSGLRKWRQHPIHQPGCFFLAENTPILDLRMVSCQAADPYLKGIRQVESVSASAKSMKNMRWIWVDAIFIFSIETVCLKIEYTSKSWYFYGEICWLTRRETGFPLVFP